MKMLSLFSGIGAFEKALERLGVSIDLVNYCEIDKYASKAFSLIHNIPEEKNLRDVREVNTRYISDIDLLTYGFPCQDISNAGLKKGFSDENGNTTRSGLFFEALRIIEGTRPKIAIAENVKALVGKRFINEFNIVLGSLSRLGYNNYYSVLNAKDYGIPQNRERVFIVSIRQDIDKGFTFPKGKELNLRLKDILEDTVNDKYFLKESRVSSLIKHKERNAEKGNGFGARFVTGSDISSAIVTDQNKSTGQYIKIEQVGNIMDDNGRDFKNPQCGRVYDPEGLSPTLNTCNGGNRQPKIICSESSKEGVLVKNYAKEITKRTDIAGCLMARDYKGFGQQQMNAVVEDHKIRKLTPKECFRLMGFDDRDIDTLRDNGISDAQLYKMAGNSIVVDVVYHIFEQLRSRYPDIFPRGQMSIEDLMREEV